MLVVIWLPGSLSLKFNETVEAYVSTLAVSSDRNHRFFMVTTL